METGAPQLPLWLLLAGVSLIAVVLWRVLARCRDLSLRFLILALTLRYLMGAFHHITYQPLLGGLSPIALASAGVFAVGLMLAPPRRLLLKALTPLYALIGAVLVAAIVNPGVGSLVDVLVKWGYFLVILLHAHEAARRLGVGAVCATLLWAFLAPFLFQIASVVMGAAKSTDEGAISYIGGYNHEAAFSIIALTAMSLAAFAASRRWWSAAVIALAVASIVLANYRTVLLAAIPLLAAWVVTAAAARFQRADRAVIALGAGALALTAAIVAGVFLQERFADFAAVWGRRLPDVSTGFTQEERDLFSSRLFLWRQYLDEFEHGSIVQWLFGNGPQAWEGRFAVYAHNTLVSTLFEYGLFGALCLIWLWASGLAMAIRAPERALRWRLVAAHVSVILMNMSTMGQWLIEGLILYAILLGCTIVLARAPAPIRARPDYRAPIPTARPRGVTTHAHLQGQDWPRA